MTNGRARTVWVGLLIGLLIVTGGVTSVTRTAAQDGDQCVALAEQAIAEAGIYCGGLLPGEACYGHGAVSARPPGAGELAAATPGDRTTLEALDALATAADPAGEGWGVAVLDLPAAEGATITGVLFGDAQIARLPAAGDERPTLPVFNRGSAEINLRNGAGINYAVVGQLAAGEEALADGRNEQGDWLRVQFAGGIAWAFTPLIGWEGDQSAISALTVLLPNDVTPVKLAGVPFESFTLTSGDAPCAAMPAGLLLQFAGEGRAEITVNQVTLAFADATLLVTAAPGDSLTARALAGAGTVTARGVPLDVAAGGGTQVNLGGADGLTPVAAPAAMRAYPFADIAYAPLDLLAEPVACLVGAPASDAQVTLRVGPGTQRGALASLSAATTYTAIGWANDSDGAPWWQLDTGAQPSWAAQAEVRAVGACQAVAQVEPPPLIFAPPPAPPAGGEAAPAGEADLAPTANSVWQMRPGSDNMTGQCSGAPAINFCDHLAAIAPAGGGLSWKGMEASPYFLSRIRPNVYAYAGPNVLGTGRVSMTLSFTSETTLTMTMSLVLNSEPNCQHVYYYTGTRNW
jgi:hypothetical protein